MNNNIPIARWLSMFWLCSAVSLVLGQFGGSVTLNGTNGAALTMMKKHGVELPVMISLTVSDLRSDR